MSVVLGSLAKGTGTGDCRPAGEAVALCPGDGVRPGAGIGPGDGGQSRFSIDSFQSWLVYDLANGEVERPAGGRPKCRWDELGLVDEALDIELRVVGERTEVNRVEAGYDWLSV